MANAIRPEKSVGRSEHPTQRMEKFSDPEALLKLHNRGLVVCHIVLSNDQGGGTGFLIGKDLIMTNNHVLDFLETARGAKALFFHTTSSKAVEVDLDPDNFFYTSLTPDPLGFKPLTQKNLDFTIVSIKSHPKIAEVSHLAFSIFGTPVPEKESHANMIHHPHQQGTTCQKISHRKNLIKEVAQFTIHYTTASLPGSSGAPVIDDEGNLIALHRATCTHILKALLEKEMLKALLHELFPSIPFINQTLILDPQSRQEKKFTGLCASMEGSLLFVFSEGMLKGQYYHEGKTKSPLSLFRLIEIQHPSPKKWSLQFLNNRLEEPLADYHCECNTAIPIKAIHDHLKINFLGTAVYDDYRIDLPKDTPLLDFVLTRYQESQKNLCTLLKESYLQQYGFLPLFLTNEAFPIQSFFTQLSIVSHTSQAKKEEEARKRDPNLIEKDSLREIYARLYETEKPIELKTLFEERENNPIKRVLVLGRAGIGKSTLCQKIAHDWASGTLFVNKFGLVYHLRLRDLNALIRKYPLKSLHPDKWLSKIIAKACYEGSQQEKIDQEIQNNPDKILLVFDGWDEASPKVIQAFETYFLHTKIKHCLLTSRPGVTQKIHNNFDLVVENMGFNETQIETYAAKFFTHTQCEGLDAFLKALRSRTNLFTIAHIPIQLQILCALWKKGEKEFPQTLTPLFSKIIYHLLTWEQKKTVQQEELTPLNKLFLYQALGEVALKGLDSKQLIIPKKLVEDALTEKSLEDSRFDTINCKKLIGTGLIKECGVNGEMYFLHLTYQEYSIAQYINNLPKSSLDKKQAQEKQCAFVQKYRYQPHFHLVIRMLAGCIWKDSKEDIKTLETFFEWLYSGHTDLIGACQTELVLSCLDECQSVDLEKRIWEKYKIGNFVESILERKTTRDYLCRLMAISKLVLTRVIQHLEKTWPQQEVFLVWFFEHVNQYSNEERMPEILNLIQKALKDHGWLVRRDAAYALGDLATHAKKDDILQILNEIKTTLKDREEDVRKAAVYALAKLVAHAEKSDTPQIFNEVQTALKDRDKDVRRNAAYALGKLATHAGKEIFPQILMEVQTALKDRDKDVRKAAAEALGKLVTLFGKENFSRILKEIQTALKDQDKDVRKAAAEALEGLATYTRNKGISQILNLIQKILNDQDPDVSNAADKALGKLVTHIDKKNIPQILNWIQMARNDPDPNGRICATKAFEKLAVHAGKKNFSQILKGTQEALNHEDRFVRGGTVEALGELTGHIGKEHIPQIFGRLQIALRDQDRYVRICATKTLGKLATHAGKESIPQILEELQTTIRDQDADVRKSAARALGEAATRAKKENILQILNGFQIALKDKDRQVRKCAAKALGELAAYIGIENIPQILKELQTALSDLDQQVRRDAAEVLREFATHAKKKNILPILNLIQKNLEDPDPDVRRHTASALGKLSTHAGKENTPQIFNLIQKTLSDQDPDVRINASKALEELAVGAGKENVLQILKVIQVTLSDKDSDVRSAATEVLCRLVAHAKKDNILQILNEIQIVFNNQDRYVRSAAAEAFGELAAHTEKGDIPQILKGLQIALRDQNEYVRKAATKTLGKLAAYAGQESILEISHAILIALKDQNEHVRNAASATLGEIVIQARKENIPQILIGLQVALGDQNEYVRRATAKTLGKLAAYAGKENIPQILNLFQMALNDREEYVYKAAAEALENLIAHVEKENIPKILNFLQMALRHQNGYIQIYAVDVLLKLASYAGKENIPSIFKELQAALSQHDLDMHRTAFKATLELKTEWLVSIFISPSLMHSQAIPTIFDDFINQSIPLYLVENSTGCFIHTSDIYFKEFDSTQSNSLSDLCNNLLLKKKQKETNAITFDEFNAFSKDSKPSVQNPTFEVPKNQPLIQIDQPPLPTSHKSPKNEDTRCNLM